MRSANWSDWILEHASVIAEAHIQSSENVGLLFSDRDESLQIARLETMPSCD